MAKAIINCFFTVFSLSWLVMTLRLFCQGEASLPVSVRDRKRENIDPGRDFPLRKKEGGTCL